MELEDVEGVEGPSSGSCFCLPTWQVWSDLVDLEIDLVAVLSSNTA
jgi:hypothetical protein